MSPASAVARLARLSETQQDQRSQYRYPIILEVEYKLRYRGRVVRFGSGRTLNISTGGVLFETSDLLPLSGPIELMVSWPVLLDGVCPIKLQMQGCVLRNDGNGVAVSVEHHEFYTAGFRSQKV